MSRPEAIDPAQQPLMGSFTLQAQLPQGKSFTVQGYLYAGEAIESINDRVDLLHDVVDRQRTRAEIPEIEAELEKVLKQLEGNKVHYALLLAKRDKGQKLTQQEKQQLDVMDVNNDLFEKNIQKGRERLAEMRAKVGVKD
jgi:hypothetical protein